MPDRGKQQLAPEGTEGCAVLRKLEGRKRQWRSQIRSLVLVCTFETDVAWGETDMHPDLAG